MVVSPEACAAFAAAVADAEVPAGLRVLGAIAVAVGPALNFAAVDLSILLAAKVRLVDSPTWFATFAAAQSSVAVVDEANAHPPQVDAQMTVI